MGSLYLLLPMPALQPLVDDDQHDGKDWKDEPEPEFVDHGERLGDLRNKGEPAQFFSSHHGNFNRPLP